MRKGILTVMPIPEVLFSEYQYFVETPEGEVLYFSEKKQARSFIEFYKSYQEKRNEKVTNHDNR